MKKKRKKMTKNDKYIFQNMNLKKLNMNFSY